MKKNSYLYIIIGILLVCNIISIASIINIKKSATASISVLYPYAKKYEILKSNLKNNFEFGGYKINPIQICTKDNLQVGLDRLVSDTMGFGIVLRTSERNCHTCVDYAVKLISSPRVRKDVSISYLFGYKRNNYFASKAEEYGLLDSMVYNYPDLEIPIDYEGFPYLMILNKDLMIEYCYFPSKGSDDIDIENINMIIDCYAKKYNVHNQ